MNKKGISIREFGNWGKLPGFIIPIVLTLLLFPIFLLAEIHPLYQQGLEQYQKKQFDSALVDFNQLIQDFPQLKEGYYNRGLCFYQSKKFDNAMADFNECLQIDSCFQKAEWMKALCLQQKGQIKASLKELKYTIRKCDNNNLDNDDNNQFHKRIKLYLLSVYVSKNWYYMVALMFMAIILIVVVVKTMAYRRG